MLFQYLINPIREIKKLFSFYTNKEPIQAKIDFDNVLDKCISENTHIIGIAGTGKSTFLAEVTSKLYKENKSYIMCANSLRELNIHFQKHTPSDNILIFGLDRNQTHTIDINYLFGLENFLDFVCISADKKQKIKNLNSQKWIDFFNNDENESFFNAGYFQYIKCLIEGGHIEYCGDLNSKFVEKPINAYVVLDCSPKFTISNNEKEQYIFLLNVIQLSLSKNKIHVIFDEERVFFNGFQNDCLKNVIIPNLENNYIFCSQSLTKLKNNTQMVILRSFSLDALHGKLQYQGIFLDIMELKQGEFLFLNNKLEPLSPKPMIIPQPALENEIAWELYLNNKQKKLHDKIQLKLEIKNDVREKKIKI